MGGRHRWQHEFFKFLDDGDTIRVGFDLERGHVLEFSVQLECWIEDRWRPVARYDTAHGFAHRDVLGWSGNVVEKTPLPANWTLKRALAYAISDLKDHAATYRSEFLGRQP